MKVTFRLPSKAVQYGYIEVEMDSMGLSPEALGEMYAKHVKGFWEGEKGAKPKAPDTAAQEEFERQLGATKVATEDNAPDSPEPTAEKPWEKKVEASPKPWENKPNLFD